MRTCSKHGYAHLQTWVTFTDRLGGEEEVAGLEGGGGRAVGRHGDERGEGGDEGGEKGGWVSFEFGRGRLKFKRGRPRGPGKVSRHPRSNHPATLSQTVPDGGNQPTCARHSGHRLRKLEIYPAPSSACDYDSNHRTMGVGRA